MLRTYLRIAARILVRNRLYTLINVLGLALGVCGCIIIWLVDSFELSFDRFHPDGERIYRVVGGGKPGEPKVPVEYHRCRRPCGLVFRGRKHDDLFYL
jgi:hypothetical protein